MLIPVYTVGQAVHVRAFGAWRPGTITALTRSRVEVRFTRNATGDTAVRRFHRADIRAENGIRLVPADQLRSGDVVLEPLPRHREHRATGSAATGSAGSRDHTSDHTASGRREPAGQQTEPTGEPIDERDVGRDAERVVAAVLARRRYRQITFTDGATSEVAARSVLRVRDHVTGHGNPEQATSVTVPPTTASTPAPISKLGRSAPASLDGSPPAPGKSAIPHWWEPTGACVFCGAALYRQHRTDTLADLVNAAGVNYCPTRIERFGGGTGHRIDQPSRM